MDRGGGGLAGVTAVTEKRAIPGFEGCKRRVREPGGFYLPNRARDGWEAEKMRTFEVPVQESMATIEG